jgi:hypothetical protein
MSAHAEKAEVFIDGNTLVEWMRGYDTNLKTKGRCLANDAKCLESMVDAHNFFGYVLGVHDATNWKYSTPDGVMDNQLCAVVSKYLKAHPERWSYSAYSLVIDALKEAFPKK